MSFGPDFSSSLPPTPALAHAQASGRAAVARLRGCEAGTARAFAPADSAAARSSSSFSSARSVRQRMASASAVVARWVVVGGAPAGGAAFGSLPMIGTASSSSSSVDRDSLACVRCSPSRAPHGPACRARACCCALARRAGARSTPKSARAMSRGGGRGGCRGCGSRE